MDRYKMLLKGIGIDHKKIDEMNDEDFEKFLNAVPNLNEHYILLNFIRETRDILKKWEKIGHKYHESLKKLKSFDGK